MLFYKKHATGIQNIKAHLRDKYAVAGKEMRAIVEYCRRWQIAALQDIQLPLPLDLTIKELGKSLVAYQRRMANSCSFCTINRNRIQKHCKNCAQDVIEG